MLSADENDKATANQRSRTSPSLDEQYRGNNPRSTEELALWHGTKKPPRAIEPGLPIVDSHHHLFGALGDNHYYRLEDLKADMNSGHNILGTVYCEAYFSGWRESGLESFRSVGEVEKIAQLTSASTDQDGTRPQIAAGIVSYIDMTLGGHVPDVLEAHLEAGDGRLRGIRHRTATHDGTIGRHIKQRPKQGLLRDSAFKQGVAHLGRYGLSFDAWVYHTQISELTELADEFPETTMILNHIGGPIGVAEYRFRRAEVHDSWERQLTELAKRPNVFVKVGGLGMAVLGFELELAAQPPDPDELAATWTPYLKTCIDIFGSERCMFESNFPVDKQSCSYAALWNAFKLCTQSMSAPARQNLFYRTACRTYRLPDLEKEADIQWHKLANCRIQH